MPARVDTRPVEYLRPAPKREQIVRVGFRPSDELDRAVRGFLLPEANRRQDSAAKLGTVALHTLHSRTFYYDRSDNNGICYYPEDAALLAQERLRFKELQSEPLPVVGMQVQHTNKNPNTMLIFELGLVERQRQLLGGLILSRALADENTILPVGIVLRRAYLAAPEVVAEHHRELAEQIVTTREAWRGRQDPAVSVPSAYHASRPYISDDHRTRV